jgi:hypothetical protein
MLVTEKADSLLWISVTDFHLMVMSVLLSAVTWIPISLEERLGVGFMETGKFRMVHW